MHTVHAAMMANSLCALKYLSNNDTELINSTNPIPIRYLHVSKNRENIRKIKKRLDSAVEIYKENNEYTSNKESVNNNGVEYTWNIINTYTNQLDIDSTNLQIWNTNLDKYVEEYKKHTGSDIKDDMNTWREYMPQIYKSIYFGINNNILSEYSIDSGLFPQNKEYKFSDLPIFTADISKYYHVLKKDFKKIMELSQRLSCTDHKKHNYKHSSIDEYMATRFMRLTHPVHIFKRFNFSDITQYNSPREYIEKELLYNVELWYMKLISGMNKTKANQRKFLGYIFYVLEEFLVSQVTVSDLEEKLLFVFSDTYKAPSNINNYTENIQLQRLLAWRLTNTAFILQIEGLFKMMEEIWEVESSNSASLRKYINDYRDRYIKTDHVYFKKMYLLISMIKHKLKVTYIKDLYAGPVKIINKGVLYLSCQMLNLIYYSSLCEDSIISINQEYISNHIYYDPDKLNEDVAKYATCVWKTAKIMKKYLNISDEDLRESPMDYSNKVLKKIIMLEAETKPSADKINQSNNSESTENSAITSIYSKFCLFITVGIHTALRALSIKN
ncbi:hypothetical protein NEIG_00640 [Nematocida sp. ERTm5]|nr:hypothetical protein NEIG_00640 [Nematocida sp. ERTm5]